MPIKAILGIGLALIALITVLNWLDETTSCFADKTRDPAECITVFITKNPEVRPALEISEACNSSGEDCLEQIGKEYLTKEIKN